MKAKTFTFEGKDHVATAGPSPDGSTWGVTITERDSGRSVYTCDMDEMTRYSVRKSPYASYFDDDAFLDSMIQDFKEQRANWRRIMKAMDENAAHKGWAALIHAGSQRSAIVARPGARGKYGATELPVQFLIDAPQPSSWLIFARLSAADPSGVFLDRGQFAMKIPRATQRVLLVSLSEAIRVVRQRAGGLGLVLPEPGQWGAALDAYLAETQTSARRVPPWAYPTTPALKAAA